MAVISKLIVTAGMRPNGDADFTLGVMFKYSERVVSIFAKSGSIDFARDFARDAFGIERTLHFQELTSGYAARAKFRLSRRAYVAGIEAARKQGVLVQYVKRLTPRYGKEVEK